MASLVWFPAEVDLDGTPIIVLPRNDSPGIYDWWTTLFRQAGIDPDVETN